MVKVVFISVTEDDKFCTDHFQKRIDAGTITSMVGGDQQIALQSTLPLHGQSQAEYSSQNNPLRIRQLPEWRR